MSYTTQEEDVFSDINFVPDVKGTGAVGYISQGTIEAVEDAASMLIVNNIYLLLHSAAVFYWQYGSQNNALQ